jgi:hypothetical protein
MVLNSSQRVRGPSARSRRHLLEPVASTANRVGEGVPAQRGKAGEGRKKGGNLVRHGVSPRPAAREKLTIERREAPSTALGFLASIVSARPRVIRAKRRSLAMRGPDIPRNPTLKPMLKLDEQYFAKANIGVGSARILHTRVAKPSFAVISVLPCPSASDPVPEQKIRSGGRASMGGNRAIADDF